MKLLVLNGPNINMIGIREPDIYGKRDYPAIVKKIEDYAAERNIEIRILQSNHEGDLVDWIQEAYFEKYDGIVMNPGAYTHTSVAILDALKAIAPIPCVEVHLSDISQRESFRHISYPAMACIAQIAGYGDDGYLMAIDTLVKHLSGN
ncbi:MAG: type II 3-dehydroquinate dehydratase [Erysipelotrichaceae bacterium]|nr:type II 3-dehydroquinate dehydratase [Erysipelotrichaceae bacterium]